MKKMFFVHERIKESPDGLLHAVAQDLVFQNFSTVQSGQSPKPVTIASSTTIAPTTGITFVTATTPNIQTITPPISDGAVMIGLIFTNAAPPQLLTTGNIAVGSTTLVQNKLNLLWYDPVSAKWYLNS